MRIFLKLKHLFMNNFLLLWGTIFGCWLTLYKMCRVKWIWTILACCAPLYMMCQVKWIWTILARCVPLRCAGWNGCKPILPAGYPCIRCAGWNGYGYGGPIEAALKLVWKEGYCPRYHCNTCQPVPSVDSYVHWNGSTFCSFFFISAIAISRTFII